jgi:hypothetical protein
MEETCKDYDTGRVWPDFERGYENRYVAFVDILGFRNKVLASEQDDYLRRRILEVLTRMFLLKPIQHGIDTSTGKYEKIEATSHEPHAYVFSDNILFTAERTAGGLIFLLHNVQRLCGELLFTFSLLTRGAIVVGQVYDDNQVVFGPAAIDAIDLEKNKAEFPRILVSRGVVEDHYRYVSQKARVEWRPPGNIPEFRKDFDGDYHVDILRAEPTWHVPEIHKPGVTSSPTKVEWLKHVRAFIISRVAENAQDSKILEKMKWFVSYFNEVVSSDSELCIEAIEETF